MNHLGTKTMETDRLILRPFTLEDAPAMYRNWASDPEVTKYLTWPTHSELGITQWVEIGYCIGRNWWHRGYMSEALKALIRFFFEEVNVGRIQARHDPRTPNSGAVMSKCGMTYEGTLRRADRNNQGICDAAVYGILREEYYADK